MTGIRLAHELDLATLPVYPGVSLAEIVLVNTEAALAEATRALPNADVLGFDSESKPVFRKGEASTGPHLIQLATDTRVYLFPVVRFAAAQPLLKQVLEAPEIRKVGMGLGNDRAALKSRLGISPCELFDLGEALRGPAHRGTVGAKVAVAHFFGQRLLKSKKTGTSNWAAAVLSERQCLYAANDAHVALKLYRRWMAMLAGEVA